MEVVYKKSDKLSKNAENLEILLEEEKEKVNVIFKTMFDLLEDKKQSVIRKLDNSLKKNIRTLEEIESKLLDQRSVLEEIGNTLQEFKIGNNEKLFELIEDYEVVKNLETVKSIEADRMILSEVSFKSFSKHLEDILLVKRNSLKISFD